MNLSTNKPKNTSLLVSERIERMQDEINKRDETIKQLQLYLDQANSELAQIRDITTNDLVLELQSPPTMSRNSNPIRGGV